MYIVTMSWNKMLFMIRVIIYPTDSPHWYRSSKGLEFQMPVVTYSEWREDKGKAKQGKHVPVWYNKNLVIMAVVTGRQYSIFTP